MEEADLVLSFSSHDPHQQQQFESLVWIQVNLCVELRYYPCVYTGFLRIPLFPPTNQKHACFGQLGTPNDLWVWEWKVCMFPMMDWPHFQDSCLRHIKYKAE